MSFPGLPANQCARVWHLALLCSVCWANLSGQSPKGTPSKPFSDWITSAGLNIEPDSPTGIVIASEELKPESYSLVVSANKLPEIIGESHAQGLYRSLLQKATVLAPVPPEQVELVIREGGNFCDGSEVKSRLSWVGGQIVSKREITTTEKPANRCAGVSAYSVNFEGYRRHEEAVVKSLTELRAKTALQSNPSTETPSDPVKIRAYLESLYQAKGASVRVIDANDHLLELVVSGVKKEVITDQSYWERLQILLLFTKLTSGTRINLVLDGKYGSGLAAPSLEGYYDLEPKYTSYLVDYGKALLVKLTEVAK